MTWRILSLASMAATLLLPALSGCAYLHKDSPAPLPIIGQAPSQDPPVTPLYSQLAEGSPTLPDLPTPPHPGAQPAPPPASVIVDTAKKSVRAGRRHGRKVEIEVAERNNHEKEPAAPPTTEVASAAPEGQNLKVTAPTPSGDTAQPTSIGILTAGATPDTSGSRQQAADLIGSTERGVNSLRNLNGDQSKTVAQIRSFLDQAQRALHNGDVDGAHTLATKAKTLLDELTGAS
jgi:hypothetical protein